MTSLIIGRADHRFLGDFVPTSRQDSSVKACTAYGTGLRRTRKPPVLQLYCLLLTLVLVTIPLNGMPAPRASSLVSLRTTFVPFDTSIGSISPTTVQFSVAAPSGRRIALAPNAISFPIPQFHSVARDIAIDDHCRSGVTGFPSVRSPPRA